MRLLSCIALCAALGAQAAGLPSRTVDLDAPGALEALKQDRPEHYAKVVDMMDKVQAVPRSGKAQRDLRFDPREPDVTRRQIETSFPAKTLLTLAVDDVEYKVTVVYLKHPATVVPAK